MMGWYDGSSMGWGGWIAMTLMMIAFWGLVIFAVVASVRGGTSKSGGHDHIARSVQRDPMKTLDERYARGEIDSDEYLRRRSVLRETVL